MKKYSTVSTSSNSSTCSNSSATSTSQDEAEYLTIHEENDKMLKEEDEEDETHVENETYTYEYVTTPATPDKLKPSDNVSEDEYVTECFEQTYSIIDILNDCEKSKNLKAVDTTVHGNELTATIRSASSMSGLSSVGSSSSSSLSNNGTSSSSININSISPNTTQTTHVDRYDSSNDQPKSNRTLNTEIYYPSSRTPYANSKLRGLSPQPIVVVTPPR